MPQAKLIIRDEVNVKIEGLELDAKRTLVNKFKYDVPYARYLPAVRLGRWDGKVAYFQLGGSTYVNLLPDIITVLDEMGYDFAGRIVWDSKGVEVINEEFTYWERLCMKDQDNFWEEMQWRYENYDTFDELVEGFELGKWKDQTILDMDRLESEYEEITSQS